MAVYSGKDGQLEFDGDVVGRIRSWSLQASYDTLDVTNLGNDARAYTPGLKNASGSASLIYHDDNLEIRSILETCITTGTPVTANFDLKWDDRRVQFNAYVNSANITCATGEVMSADISFTMTGDYQSITL